MAVKFETGTMDPISSNSPPRINVVHISLEKLVPFTGHPFKPYTEQKLKDLAKSIEENGVLTPIIVRRSTDEEKYEILAGHNRVEAARIAKLSAIPATICAPESEEEAQILVVESNFNQRSIKDMMPSELANSLHMLNEAMKKRPGYRSDLKEADEDGSQSETRSRTMHVIGDKFGLSRASIARYIRAAKLSKGLQECLDKKQIGLGVAEHLSYLRPSEQDIVQNLLKENTKIDIPQAKKLKEQSSDHELDENEIKQILQPKASAPTRRAIKFREDLFTKYFTEDQSPEEIEDTIARALELLWQQSPAQIAVPATSASAIL